MQLICDQLVPLKSDHSVALGQCLQLLASARIGVVNRYPVGQPATDITTSMAIYA